MKYVKSAGFIKKTYTNISHSNEDVYLQNQIKDRKHSNAINTSACVRYSLNKDGRWELPANLKHDIQSNGVQDKHLHVDNQKQHKKLSKRRDKKKKKFNESDNPEVMYIEEAHSPWNTRSSHVSYLSSGKTW